MKPCPGCGQPTQDADCSECRGETTTPWRPIYAQEVELPDGWQTDVADALAAHGIDTVMRGDSVTSGEVGGEATTLRVLDGTAIRRCLPWLWTLYAGPLKAFAEAQFQRPLFTQALEHAAVNVNGLAGPGARYEWHVDSNPVTGLLYATSAADDQGGVLVFRHPETEREVRVQPKVGMFVCFDARRLMHRVEPLAYGSRISIPMNYFDSPDKQDRPADLEAHMYTKAEAL